MKNFILNGFFLLLLLSFVACNNDDDAPELYGDAYILSEDSISNTGEKAVYYNLVLSSSCNNYIINSTTANMGTKSYTLNTSDGSNFYAKEGPFSTYDDLIGKYTFNFSFILTDPDILYDEITSEVLMPATITSCTGADDGNKLTISLKWNRLENADALFVRIKDSTNKIIFTSMTNYYDYYTLLDNSEYTISNTTGTWFEDATLSKDETYTVEIVASVLDFGLTIQSESLAKAIVIWE